MRKIILKTALLPVLIGAGIAATATAAKADIDLRFNIGPPTYYYYGPPAPRYYGPGYCYWDSMAGRVCTY